jgi:DNA invertase Pin-like site-specific DNA recombinase
MNYASQTLQPKNGQFFSVLGVCRISTSHQNGRSLDDQRALYVEWLEQEYGKNYRLDVIQGTGSGEDLTRPALQELQDRLEKGDLDVVITEDLGRIARRLAASQICEIAEDVGTRVVAINDHVDTSNPDWRMSSMFACLRHETYNRDTSSRIRRSLRNRFSQGDVVQSLPYGYFKPHAHASDSECSKLPEAQEIYDQVFRRLEDGQTFAQVSDWMNEQKVPTGSACRTPIWTGSLLATVIRNPILKGVRQRNRRVTVRINRTGRRKTEPATPDMLLERHVPHLAFIEPLRYDRVIRQLRLRNQKYRRAESVRNDPRAGISKKQTRWPGQHLRCGVCGRLFVWGGHGRNDRLMCNGVREHHCWNSVTVHGTTLSQALAAEVRRQIEILPDFDAKWLEQLNSEAASLLAANDLQRQQLEQELAHARREVENLIDFISGGHRSDSIAARLRIAESRQTEIHDAIDLLTHQRPVEVQLPPAEELRQLANAAFANLAVESRDFGDLMRTVIDNLYVLPFHLLGGGHPQPRCSFTLNLSTLLHGCDLMVLRQLSILSLPCAVDLTVAPQYERIRPDVIAMRAQRMTERNIAAQLGVTVTAVQHAASLQRKMDAQGLTSPWVPILNEEAVRKTFKRVHHARYQFQPLPGFEHPRQLGGQHEDVTPTQSDP